MSILVLAAICIAFYIVQARSKSPLEISTAEIFLTNRDPSGSSSGDGDMANTQPFSIPSASTDPWADEAAIEAERQRDYVAYRMGGEHPYGDTNRPN